MKLFKPFRIGLCAAAAGWLLLTAACGGNKPEPSRPGGGMEDARTHALFDRDSRNNEDPSLGVKPHWAATPGKHESQPYAGRQTLDMTNEHDSQSFGFHPQTAERLSRLPGIEAAYVLVSEANAYIAVVPEGHRPEQEARAEMMQYQVKQSGGVGLFGAGDAGRFDWTEQGDFRNSDADRVRSEAARTLPGNIETIYVSANPNFVQRVRFYEKEAQERGDLSVYYNEFNTLVQRVFPRDANTR
jgi:hypothetical protein